MTGHDIAKLLIEQEVYEMRTVLRDPTLRGVPHVDWSGEATVVWTARLRAGTSSLSGIDIEVKSIRAWGEMVAEDGTASEYDIVYPDLGGHVPDDADVRDMIDAIGGAQWSVETDGELRMPRRPYELVIDFSRKLLTVNFE